MHSTPPSEPLAERMRPRSLEQFFGQQHLVAPGMPVYNMLQRGALSSMIFWGPPGVGKTTLAQMIAEVTDQPFFQLSAISSGVKEVRTVIAEARMAGKAILFIDEIHRFNKAQQDSLLAAVEKGLLTLIGATTENPSFEVISALLSRCQVYVLEPLSEAELKNIIKSALIRDEWLAAQHLQIENWEALIRLSGGDGRRILNMLELVAKNLQPGDHTITDERVTDIIQQKMPLYDKTGEQHYDLISAFIKSIRGSDPNAAVYYLARMIEGGEDAKFIARRLVILASEDIGNANPNALLLATTCFQAVNLIGYPESRIILSQTTIYLAGSPKSNAAYMAIQAAQDLVRKTGDLSIPLSIRNAPTSLMKSLQYGKNYAYAHNYKDNFADMEFMPDSLRGTKLYEPGDNPQEEKQRLWLRNLWKEKYGY